MSKTGEQEVPISICTTHIMHRLMQLHTLSPISHIIYVYQGKRIALPHFHFKLMYIIDKTKLRMSTQET